MFPLKSELYQAALMRLVPSIKNESASSPQFLRKRAVNTNELQCTELEIRKEIREKKNIQNYFLRLNDTFWPDLGGFWML